MAATRNKNTRGNYTLDKRQNQNQEQWRLYVNGAGGYACDPHLPGLGFGPAAIPWNVLSRNAADTESFLRGIGATNLEEPSPPLFTPAPVFLTPINMFEKSPVYMPEPLVVSKENRPLLG